MKATSPLPSPPTTTGNDASSDNEATKNHPTEHHQKKQGGKKRKQKNRKQQFAGIEELEIERYDKLFYQAQKQLKSKVKQIKTFLVQKEIRRQKQKQEKQKKETDEASNAVVESMKKIDIDVVTQQALRRLGLYHCNPRLKYDEEQQQQENKEEEDEGNPDSDDGDSHSGSSGADKKEEEQNDVKDRKNMPTKGKKKHSPHGKDSPLVIPPTLIGSTNEENDPTIRYLSSILDHKKFVECMEEWNMKVTQHRRFCMQMEERERRRSNPSLFGPDSKSRKKRKKSHQQQKTTSMFSSNITATGVTAIKDSVNEQPTALFGRLGGGDNNDSDGGFSGNDGDGAENSFSVYGPGANLTDGDVFGGVSQPPQRKNRKGQRARRAKAAAIEAKKQGKSGREYYYESLNWRPKKQQQQQQQEVSDDQYQHQQYQSYDSGRMGSARGDNKNSQKKYDFGKEDMFSSSRSGSGAPPAAAAVAPAVVDPASAHPSWAAKQSQKTGIVAFKGTKITFD